MSAESAPTTTPTLTAEQRFQREQMMLNGLGGEVTEDRAQDVLNYGTTSVEVKSEVPAVAAEVEVPVAATDIEGTPEVTEEGADILAELTLPEDTPDDNDEVLAAAAAARQLDMKRIYEKHDIEARAAREDWPNEKVQSELARIAAK